MKTAIINTVMDIDNNASAIFNKDCADKKRTAHGVTGRRKKMTIPVPTKKEVQAKHGPVMTFEMHKPMAWAEFTQMPKDIQSEYLTGLVKKFNITTLDLTQLFGCKKTALSNYLNNNKMVLAVSASRNWDKPTDRAGWSNFCNQIWAPEKVVSTPVVKEIVEPATKQTSIEKKPEKVSAEQLNRKAAIAKRMAALASEYNITRGEILNKAGVSQPMYYHIVNDKTNILDKTYKKVENTLDEIEKSFEAVVSAKAKELVTAQREKHKAILIRRVNNICKRYNISISGLFKNINISVKTYSNCKPGYSISEKKIHEVNKALDAFEQSRSVKNSTKILSDCTAKERALSARIHALATKNDVSIWRLAAAAGISCGTCSNICKGNPVKSKTLNMVEHRLNTYEGKLRKEVADKTNAEQQANKSYANGEVILRGNAKAVKKALEKLLDNADNEIEVKIFDFA